MALHNGIDTVAVASFGVYTETYGAANKGAIANLYASLGYLEDAPLPTLGGGFSKYLLGITNFFRRRRRGR